MRSVIKKANVFVLSLMFVACNKIKFNMMSDDGDNIAATAEKYVGETDWAYNRKKDNFPANSHKCNKFVYDVLKEAGVYAPAYEIKSDSPISPFENPIVSADWSDPDAKIPYWDYIGSGRRCSRKKGDVIAEKRNYSDASGHCGIAVSSSEVVAATRNEVTKGSHGLQDGTVRRYNPWH
jgi:hypothetical protein